KLLPTGNPQDVVQLEDGAQLTVTLGDLANPCVFVHAQDIGLTGSEMPVQINENQTLIFRLKEIRGRAAVLAGFCDDWTQADAASPSLPLVVIIAPSEDYSDMNGKAVLQEHMDLRARLVFYTKCHESMAGTGSMGTAAFSRVPNTMVNLTARNTEGDTLRIGHPLGVMHVAADADSDTAQEAVRFKRLGFSRTARRIMSGTVYIPNQQASGEIE